MPQDHAILALENLNEKIGALMAERSMLLSDLTRLHLLIQSISDRATTQMFREDKDFESGLRDLHIFIGGMYAESKSVLKTWGLPKKEKGDGDEA